MSVRGAIFKPCEAPKEHFAPVLFHRVYELLAQSRAKFITSATAGKATVSVLPFKERPLAVSSDHDFGCAAVANPALPRIIGNLPSSRSAGVQFFELACMESVARQALWPSPLRWSPLHRPRLLQPPFDKRSVGKSFFPIFRLILDLTFALTLRALHLRVCTCLMMRLCLRS